MACLTLWPASIYGGVVPRSWLDVFVRGVARDDVSTLLHRWLVWPARGAVLGAWLSAIVVPLDWDRAWQRWPVPGVAAALLGYAIGLASAALANLTA
jgi:phosphatidylinositol glycan class F